jgi:hypothetical protein
MPMRPELNEISIPSGVNHQFPECASQMALPGIRTVTMSVGQWDSLLQATYNAGWLLLELDNNERVVCAYRLPMS